MRRTSIVIPGLGALTWSNPYEALRRGRCHVTNAPSRRGRRGDHLASRGRGSGVTRATDLCYLDASGRATKLRTREVSSEEVVRAYLERVDAINPRINVIVAVAENAIERASAADRAFSAGVEVGPLRGVPITIKDSLDTVGLRTADHRLH